MPYYGQEFKGLWERLKTFGVGSGVSEEERVIREEFDKLDTGK